jgi:uncharacterized membrane protein
MDKTPAAQPKPSPQLKKRYAIPIILLALFGLLLWGAILRGTSADAVPQNPATSAEGIVAQLYQVAHDRKQVRMATVVDFPMEEVWAVVTDYEHFSEIFPYVKSLQSTRDPDGRHHVTGVVSTLLGSWPFEIRATHEEYRDDCQVYWNQPSGDLTVNHGSWLLARMGVDRTLLVYSLELEVGSYPDFLVRNALLSGLKPVVAAVNNRLQTQAQTRRN